MNVYFTVCEPLILLTHNGFWRCSIYLALVIDPDKSIRLKQVSTVRYGRQKGTRACISGQDEWYEYGLQIRKLCLVRLLLAFVFGPIKLCPSDETKIIQESAPCYCL